MSLLRWRRRSVVGRGGRARLGRRGRRRQGGTLAVLALLVLALQRRSGCDELVRRGRLARAAGLGRTRERRRLVLVHGRGRSGRHAEEKLRGGAERRKMSGGRKEATEQIAVTFGWSATGVTLRAWLGCCRMHLQEYTSTSRRRWQSVRGLGQAGGRPGSTCS